MRNLLVATAIATLLSTPTLAAQWQVDPATSRLTFEAEQSGEKFTGSFTTFTAAIDFDEAAPEKGKITATIDMASATTDDKDRRDTLPTNDWFAVKQFPTATFTSTSIRKTGDRQFEAKGPLTIKGISKEISLPFTLATTGKSTIATGGVSLNRNDYSIGQGEWKTDNYIKFPVRVQFEIHASTK